MRLAVTCGDINGIGPEIAAKALLKKLKSKNKTKFLLVIPAGIFQNCIADMQTEVPYEVIQPGGSFSNDSRILTVINIKNRDQKIGIPTRESGLAALSALEEVRKLIRNKTAEGLITAPISKDAITRAGSKFHGHTEMLASWFGTADYTMMFYSKKLIGALLTIHEPIKKVPRLITIPLLRKQFNVVHAFLQNDLGIVNPNIAYLGLNPHAGENGLIGSEEETIKSFLADKADICHGPFPADGFFGAGLYKHFSCIIAAYHDQLLIPFKLLTMTSGVNVTAGLPFVRTSPDHGTAFDIAGKNIADYRSMLNAIELAEKIAYNRCKACH